MNPFQSLVSEHSTAKRLPLPGLSDLAAGILRDDSFDEVNAETPNHVLATSKLRRQLRGGDYDGCDALELLNSWYLIGSTDEETAIFRIRDDESLTFIPREQFRIAVSDIFVKDGHSGERRIPAEKFWMTNPKRRRCNIVFKPGGDAGPEEYNAWRGFAVVPCPSRKKLRRLLKHIRRIICREDRDKYKYVIRWLAFAVQHPDKHPGTVLVLKSRVQGTGKSTLGKVMCDIFGQHALVVDDQDRLLGRFTDRLETVCFVQAEEMMWAGDAKTADKLKSRITADTIPIEAKFRKCREVPNRMHVIMTTNHEHAVAAGARDRRYFVLDVADTVAQDKKWFGPLYNDLAEGGTAEFLSYLLNVKLGDWHPRDILRTAEGTEQQRMSSDGMAQWMQACIDADAIVGTQSGLGIDLQQLVSSETLRSAYTGYCQQHRLRAENTDALGKRLSGVFGPRARLPATSGPRRPWGYYVVDGNAWQRKLDELLGI